jgi:hypothetical protein
MLTRSIRFALLGCLFASASGYAQSPAAIDVFVRVFDGVEEVTTDCRITVYAAATRGTPLTSDLSQVDGHHVEVEPGFYDLQILRHDPNGAAVIEWINYLSFLPYSDEGRRHVEIVNLQPVFGALLIRPPVLWRENADDWRASAFLHDSQGRAGFEPSGGTDHGLFILPAGHYDLVMRMGSTEFRVTDVEVPRQRTRLKVLEIP